MLPHRYPFLLVDRVLEVNQVLNGTSHVGSKLKAIKSVTINEPFFNGHFPGKPIMPGVLIIEALAQAAGLLGYSPRADGQPRSFLIMGVDKTRWRRQVVPGDQLVLEVEMIKDRTKVFIFDCKASVDGE